MKMKTERVRLVAEITVSTEEERDLCCLWRKMEAMDESLTWERFLAKALAAGLEDLKAADNEGAFDD